MRTVLALAAVAAVATGQPATAVTTGLTITVPSPADFGSRSVADGSFSASLGNVTVSTSNGGGWVAKVSTSGFTGGAGGQSIPPGNVSYAPGAATASGLALGLCDAGGGVLSSQVTAYSCGTVVALTGTTVRWNPTITITLPATATVGIYSGTITHSVA